MPSYTSLDTNMPAPSLVYNSFNIAPLPGESKWALRTPPNTTIQPQPQQPQQYQPQEMREEEEESR